MKVYKIKISFTFIVIIVAFIPWVVHAGGIIQLPQTGQTSCYDASGTNFACSGTGQDGALQMGVAWPKPRFSDKGNQTLLDNLTGLVWTKDGNTTGPAACNPGMKKTWQGALDHVKCLNANNYLGYNDWRLPNVNELESLVNTANYNQAVWLNSQGFTNVQANWYWSSSSVVFKADYAWIVYMYFGSTWDGISERNDKFSTQDVWPVRAGKSGSGEASVISLPKTGQTTCYNASGSVIDCAGTGQDGELQMGTAWPSTRFIENGDQTITDGLTGLIWTKDGKTPGPSGCAAGSSKLWQNALDYIQCLNTSNYLGYKDWRLPNRKELRSLVNVSQSNSALWLNSQGFTNVQEENYWSSSTGAYNWGGAWAAYLWDGRLGSYGKSLVNFYAWPVRSGQSVEMISLRVSKFGTGAGTVTSDPSGIHCDASCDAAFGMGTSVTLTATPGSGSYFSGWSGGGCSGAGQCTVKMDSAKNVTAIFTVNSYALTVYNSGTGIGSVLASSGTLEWTGNIGTARYAHGTTVTLTALPHASSEFTGWNGEGCSGTGTCTVVMDRNKAVTPIFVLKSSIFQKGDITGDNNITLADAILVLKFLAGIAPSANNIYKQADINEDEKIGVEEAIFILQKLSEMRFPGKVIASAMIGSAGGTIEVTDPSNPLFRTKIDIPPGALSKDTTITIASVLTSPVPPNGLEPTGPYVEFGPDGLQFNKPITITLPSGSGDFVNASDLMYVYRNGSFSIVSSPYINSSSENGSEDGSDDGSDDHSDIDESSQRIDIDNKFMIGSLDHFSGFRLFSDQEIEEKINNAIPGSIIQIPYNATVCNKIPNRTSPIKNIIIHSTGGDDLNLRRWAHTINSGKGNNPCNFGTYYIDCHGRILQVAGEEKTTNHTYGFNTGSIGIEMLDSKECSNNADDYTDDALKSLKSIIGKIANEASKNGITISTNNIWRHYDKSKDINCNDQPKYFPPNTKSPPPWLAIQQNLNNNEPTLEGACELYKKWKKDPFRWNNLTSQQWETKKTDLLSTSGPCNYRIEPSGQTFDANGGNGDIVVTTSGYCEWMAVTNDAWITVTSVSTQKGVGTITYTVEPNETMDDRSGVIFIEGQNLIVRQSGVECAYTLSSASQSFDSKGGTGSVSVTTKDSCNWVVTNNASWISITSASIGSGSGTVNFTIVANTGTSQRTETITIAGQTFTVTQAGVGNVTGIWYGSLNLPGVSIPGYSGCSPQTVSFSLSLNEDAAMNITGSTSNDRTITAGSRNGNSIKVILNTMYGLRGPYYWNWNNANTITGAMAFFCYDLSTGALLREGTETFTVERYQP